MTKKWSFLFYALIFLIALFPFFEIPAQKYTPFVLSFLNSIVILAIVYAASTKRKQFLVVLGLGLLTLLFVWLPDIQVTHITLLILQIFLYAYAIYLISQYLVSSKGVDASEVYAATSLYLLLGLTWSMAYELVAILQPGSFNNVDQWTDLIYFSFVTLTTLGYGDITPVTAIARSVCILEALSGIFCLGIFVAGTIGRFVAMNIALRRK